MPRESYPPPAVHQPVTDTPEIKPKVKSWDPRALGGSTALLGHPGWGEAAEEKAANTHHPGGSGNFSPTISQLPDSLATPVLIQIVAFIPICPRFITETPTMLMWRVSAMRFTG